MAVTGPRGREFEFDEGFQRECDLDADRAFRQQASQRLGRALAVEPRRSETLSRGSVETVVVLIMMVLLGAFLVARFFHDWMPSISSLR